MNTISIVTRDVQQFLKSPLILWAESFLSNDQKITYEQLINSSCFHTIIRSIDPRLQNSRLPNEATDTNSRLVNLDFILRSIRSFVQDVLHSIIVAKLPNIYAIAHDPFAGESKEKFDEIDRILLLLLACSISGGDRKELHIEYLTKLNQSIQESLMPKIEELTDDINTIFQPQTYFFDENFNTNNDKRLKCLFMNLSNVIEERDHYFEEILELEQDKEILKEKLEFYQSSSNNLLNVVGPTSTNLRSTPSQTSLNTFLNDLETKNPGIEITEYKTKMRQMKSDLDDQLDTIETMREEFEILQNENQRLKNENIELSQNARLSRLYRDEIDTLNERISKMEKYHQELERYKERCQDFEHLKTNLDELKNENEILCRARSHLEQQVEEYRCRINEMFQSEFDVMKFQRDIETVTAERDTFREKLSTILEDKVRLEFDLTSTSQTVETLNNQLDAIKTRQREQNDESRPLSISFQIQQTIKNRLLKYDLDNQQLNDQLTSLKERYEIDMHRKRIEEEKQQIHLELLNGQITEYVQTIQTLELQLDRLTKEKFQLENQNQNQRIENEKVRSEFETTTKHLKLTLNTIQQREQMETTAKVFDIEQENKRLQDRIGDLTQQLSQIQIERDHLIIVKERENALNERIINLQLKFDQLAREDLAKEKRCEMFEKNFQHFENIQSELLEFKHRNECLTRQVAHFNDLENQLIVKQLEFERIEKENDDLKNQLKKLNDYVANEETASRQLKNDYFLLKQRYNDDQWNELTKKLNEASDMTRQIQIKLKKKQDESEQLKKTIFQHETTIEQLRNDLKNECQWRDEYLQESSAEISDFIEKKKNDEVAEIQQRFDLAMKSDRIHVSIQRSLKETIETLNHHLHDLQTDKIRLQTDLCQTTQRLEQIQQENLQQRQTIEQIEHERSLSMKSCQHFQQTNEQLIHDHDQLQKLYTKLEEEFDVTIQQLTDQRTTNRMLTKECKYLRIELETLQKEKENSMNRINFLLNQIRQLEMKLAERQPFDEQYFLLQKQYQLRTEDLQNTMKINENLTNELNQIQNQCVTINTEYNNLLAKHEFLEQQTERTEEEKSQLIEQLHNLVQQNQNVLAQALSNKDLFHEEARGYLEQLHQLMRQKELLEMKIMEQYKNMPIQKPRRSRGLIQSVSRKTRNILDRLTTRRTRTPSADGQIYLADSSEFRAASPSISSVEQTTTIVSNVRSTTPDVISSSLTSARHYQPSASALYNNQKDADRLHQSTDSLADSSSKEDDGRESPLIDKAKTSTPLRTHRSPEFVLNNHRQSPFRPIRDSPAPQHSNQDVSSSSTHQQRRCSSTQSFLTHPHEHQTSNIHSSMRRHRLKPTIVSSPLAVKASSPSSYNDHVLITEFGAI